MTDIDREVAEKVMGWRVHSLGPMSAYLVGPDRLRWPSDWSPSTRIDHAWEVVNAIGHPYTWDIRSHLFMNDAWQASISIWSDDGLRMGVYAGATAETAPLAICRAALAVVESRTD